MIQNDEITDKQGEPLQNLEEKVEENRTKKAYIIHYGLFIAFAIILFLVLVAIADNIYAWISTEMFSKLDWN
jgi:uncharacterized membrane protein